MRHLGIVSSAYTDIVLPPPEYVGPTSSFTFAAGTTSFDVNPNLNAVVGDLIVVVVTGDGTIPSTPAITPPVGWTTAYEVSQGVTAWVFHGTHDGSATYTFNRPVSTPAIVVCGGVFAEAAFDTVVGVWDGTILTPYIPSITPSADSLIMGGWGCGTSDNNSRVPTGFRVIPDFAAGGMAMEAGISVDSYPGGVATGNIPASVNYLATRNMHSFAVSIKGTGIARSEPVGIRLMETTSWWASSATGVNVELPGYMPGDLLFALACIRLDEVITPPVGWTLLFNDIPTSGFARGVVYYRIADGTEGESAGFGWTTAQKASGITGLVVGSDPVAPIDVSSPVAKGGLSTTATMDSVDVTMPNSLLIALGWCDNNGSWTATAPLILHRTMSTTNTNETSVGVGAEVLSASGPTGTRDLNPQNSFWCAALVAIAPEPIPPLPTFIAAGNHVAFGTGAVSVPLPAGLSTNDLLLLVVESQADDYPSISDHNGGAWNEIPDSPQGGQFDAARLNVFYSFYNGTQGDPSITSFTNHKLARTYAFRGVNTTTPFNATSGGTNSSGNDTLSIGGDTTIVENCLVVIIAADDADNVAAPHFSSWTNGNLANITDIGQAATSSGNGGGFGVATGEKATPGNYATTTVTQPATATFSCFITLALQPSGA